MFCLWFFQQQNTENNNASKQNFPQVLLFLALSSFMEEKISFMPILGEVCKVQKVWLCSLADPFIWNIFKSFEEKPTFQTIADMSWPGYILVHSEQALSSPPNPSFTREVENSFLSSKWGPDSGFHLYSREKESVRADITQPPLPSSPSEEAQLSLLF